MFIQELPYTLHQRYLKAVKKHLEENDPDEVTNFEKNAQVFVKKVLDNFKDYEFVSD